MKLERSLPSALGAIVAAFACLGLLCGCTRAQESGTETKAGPPAETGTVDQASGKKFEEFAPDNFSAPTRIDNEWLPMKPGTRWVYGGTTIEDDGTAVPHRVEMIVTDLTKVIAGIRSVVVLDLDYSDGDLVEAELAFFAQDNFGNVWHLGQYPEEYERGRLVAVLPWIHGIEDARAGIVMKARPQAGTPGYSQGWGPAVNWTDRAKVDRMGEKTRVPADHYEDVLVIAETSRTEPHAEQLKYYARGVGTVRVGWRGTGEKTRETLELMKIEQLGPKALAEVRAKALKLEKSAYKHSRNVYLHTSPAEPMSRTTRRERGGKGD